MTTLKSVNHFAKAHTIHILYLLQNETLRSKPCHDSFNPNNAHIYRINISNNAKYTHWCNAFKTIQQKYSWLTVFLDIMAWMSQTFLISTRKETIIGSKAQREKLDLYMHQPRPRSKISSSGFWLISLSDHQRETDAHFYSELVLIFFFIFYYFDNLYSALVIRPICVLYVC